MPDILLMQSYTCNLDNQVKHIVNKHNLDKIKTKLAITSHKVT